MGQAAICAARASDSLEAVRPLPKRSSQLEAGSQQQHKSKACVSHTHTVPTHTLLHAAPISLTEID